MGLNDLIISDGNIQNIHISLNSVEVFFTSYQEKEYCILFENILSIKTFFPINSDLSHANCVSNSDLTKETFKIITDENPDNFKSFQFVNVDDIVFLEIIASTVKVEEI